MEFNLYRERHFSLAFLSSLFILFHRHTHSLFLYLSLSLSHTHTLSLSLHPHLLGAAIAHPAPARIATRPVHQRVRVEGYYNPWCHTPLRPRHTRRAQIVLARVAAVGGLGALGITGVGE